MFGPRIAAGKGRCTGPRGAKRARQNGPWGEEERSSAKAAAIQEQPLLGMILSDAGQEHRDIPPLQLSERTGSQISSAPVASPNVGDDYFSPFPGSLRFLLMGKTGAGRSPV